MNGQTSHGVSIQWILLSNKKEWALDAYNNLDRSQSNYAE